MSAACTKGLWTLLFVRCHQPSNAVLRKRSMKVVSGKKGRRVECPRMTASRFVTGSWLDRGRILFRRDGCTLPLASTRVVLCRSLLQQTSWAVQIRPVKQISEPANGAAVGRMLNLDAKCSFFESRCKQPCLRKTVTTNSPIALMRVQGHCKSNSNSYMKIRSGSSIKKYCRTIKLRLY